MGIKKTGCDTLDVHSAYNELLVFTAVAMPTVEPISVLVLGSWCLEQLLATAINLLVKHFVSKCLFADLFL